MARAGTARHRGRNTQGHSEGGDDVQRSLELLDRVLSEFDDIENANQMLQQQALLGTTVVTTTGSDSVTTTTHAQKTTVILSSQDTNKKNIDSGTGNVSSTPDDDSPSLGGHQSEDDGYMSMNGRKAKFALSFNPVNEVIMQHQELQQHQAQPSIGTNNSTTNNIVMECDTNTSNLVSNISSQTQQTTTSEMDFPPPPEEAERLIATLLPRVSPGNSAKRNVEKRKNNNQCKTRTEILTSPLSQFNKYNNIEYIINGEKGGITAATQTTLPKTRHQRPYGWEKSNSAEGFRLHPDAQQKTSIGQRYASLPYDSRNPNAILTSPTWVPPRTIPGAADRHREVCRRRVESDDNLITDLDDNALLRPLSELADDEHFSDDSLEEALPPPPPSACSKRSSIAWEVSIGDDDPLLTPGSTKVVRRRRRKSGDQSHSSTSSIPNRLKDLDDWPDPPPCSTEDEIVSPFSDSDDPILLPDDVQSSDFSNSGTYVIRRGRKERKPLHNVSLSPNSNLSLNSRLSSDLSIPHSRFSGGTDWNNSSIFSRELMTPNSRISIDLSMPNSRISQELNSPKSRYSLDLNISRDSSHSSQSRRSSDPNYSRSSTPSRHNEFKKHSTTFDNFKSLIKEGVIETYSPPQEEIPMPFNDQMPPNLVRVVSLPTLSADEYQPRRELTVTVEEEEDIESPRQTSTAMSPLRKIEENISSLLERKDLDVSRLRLEDRNYKDTLQLNLKSHLSHHSKPKHVPYNNEPPKYEIQKSSSNSEIRKQKSLENKQIEGSPSKLKRNGGIQKSESAKEMLLSHQLEMEKSWPLSNSNSVDFPVHVEVVPHDFPPLPPSPVEEDEDEYQEIANPAQKRADTLPSTSEPPAVPPHREPITNSLKSRSMDAEFSRGNRNNYSGRQVPSERRTLPTELPGTKRRTFLKRSSQSPREEHHMQTSCSLPETPIFARGCDIPRTPHRRAPDVPAVGSRTAPRQSNTMGTLNTVSNLTNTGGYRRGVSSTGLEQAMVGAELLRLAGGPGRGWYPRHRHPRPASIEHLDRLAPGHHSSNPWDNTKKPLTLPPNLTPKFYQRSPREALRRVTSLLIRKGNSGKDSSKKEKDALSPSGHSANGDEGHKKKGFFKSFWKRSRHYSLEQ